MLWEHVAFSSLQSKYDQDFKIIVNIFQREVLLSDGRAKKLIKVQGIRARVFVLFKNDEENVFLFKKDNYWQSLLILILISR